MFASLCCQSFCASTLSPARPSAVARCKVTPETVTSVAARTTVVPEVADVISTEHEPVPPLVLHEFTLPTKLPGPLWIEKLIVVPSGALTKPAPLFTFTCPGYPEFAPRRFVGDSRRIRMGHSTPCNGSHAPVEGRN